MRIDKLLSNLKYGSRQAITKDIKSGKLFVNDTLVTKESLIINPEVDEIVFDGIKVFYKSEINIAINKPIGYLSANRDSMHKCVIELLEEPYNRFDYAIAGRLDLESEGLLILTTNGNFAHEIMSPKKHIDKIYEVILDKPYIENGLLYQGVEILDGNKNVYVAKAKQITIIEDKKLEIKIDMGKFHQVRNMFKKIGYEVINLKRIQIGKLKITYLEDKLYKTFDRGDLF